MEDITARAYRMAKEQKALVVLTVDPDGLWTLIPISMELIPDFPGWHGEWARLWEAAVDDARADWGG